ncbi:hypothetical protein OCU04_011558 [Sclerotinia nivalis]|uniref:Uncharacterized protein n=1 Tax=Sclerotinia nivalis TaxID=352851 RepID=A0A9X0ABR6_9HELO|nr:hypothetical protein OCU04_011558 [Sclerotinia nivalis]
MASGSTSTNNATPISIEGIRTEIQRVFGQWPTIIQILAELDTPITPNLATDPNEQTVYLNYIFFIIENRFTIQTTHIAIQTNKIEKFKTENIELLRILIGKQAQLNTDNAIINQKPTTPYQIQKDPFVFKDERSNILVRQKNYQS